MSKLLDSGTLSAFCEGVAMMLSAGIQVDEAVHLLSASMEDTDFKTACDQVYFSLIDGKPLGVAMDETKAFPQYAVDMVNAGEESGHLENVLNSLAIYYSEEDRMFAKMRSAILYPAALLAIMTVILLFTVTRILPVFMDVYSSVSGELYAGSFAYVNISMGIGWAALIIMGLCTVIALVAAVASGGGKSRLKLIGVMEKFSLSKDAMLHMALARFTSALSTYVSAGMDTEHAMESAIKMTTHNSLRRDAEKVLADMVSPTEPKSMAQAIYDHELFDPMYARMLLIGGRSGTTETVLERLSDQFFDDAVIRIDSLIDSVEPSLAAFLTVSVGATLIAVMMPLVGIMGSIG
ncbi:MAG: type II secretion system F family protein [Coriobacteriia bacterium]|nr:type II secretion system F family protein [Coriobacteriia bacterium]